MVIRHNVEGYENFQKLMKELEAKKATIYLLFSGSSDASPGKSWCPDCKAAEPVIEKALQSVGDTNHFVHVGIGELAKWKDGSSQFKKDEKLQLTSLPTLMRWGGAAKVVKEECAKPDVVQRFFENK